MMFMEITPRELRDVEIKEGLRGYHRDEVNDLLERAAQTIDAANARIQQLTDRLSSAQSEAGRTRETEDVLHRTLLLAQRAADEAVAEATAKARQMLDDADIQSRRLVADAEAEARRKGESERRRLEEEVLDLAGRRDALLADVEALTRFEAEYRERMVRALEADLFALRSRPTTAPGSRPEPSDIQIPEPEDDAPAANVDAAPSPAPPAPPQQSPSQPQPAAPAPPTPRPAPPVAASAPVSAPVAPAPAPANAMEDASASKATREVDVRTLFEQSEPKPARLVDEPSGPVRTPSPIDLLGNDGADADVLDDDAFFATLRDAVHDDAPLGPRDDDDATGDHAFFDQDADRGGFRDVFRRRR
jgi:DivIVA domain-containing protein